MMERSMNSHPVFGELELLRWSEALAGIARTGLGFTKNLFERERFEEILAVAGEIRASVDGSFDPDRRIEEWMEAVGHGVAGYVTPKIAVGAVVGNEERQLLLIKRKDSGRWLYPTGWADVGYSSSEVAIKEVLEETGIECEPIRLIAVLDSLRHGFTSVPTYSLVYLCKAVGGDLKVHELECTDAGFFSEEKLPSPLAGPKFWAAHAFASLKGESSEVLFDLPRSPVWRLPVSSGSDGGAGN